MKTKKRETTYSTEQVMQRVEQYIHASAERLRVRLQNAWKKQAVVKTKAYDKTAL